MAPAEVAGGTFTQWSERCGDSYSERSEEHLLTSELVSSSALLTRLKVIRRKSSQTMLAETAF